MSSLTPEERQRIIEEQGIRNKENMKTGFKTIGKIYLIVGAVVIVVLICVCLLMTGVLGGILQSFGG